MAVECGIDRICVRVVVFWKVVGEDVPCENRVPSLLYSELLQAAFLL